MLETGRLIAFLRSLMFTRVLHSHPEGLILKNESLFAVFRIIAIVLGSDGSFSQIERTWFFRLLRKYGVNSDQLQVLAGEMRSHSNVIELFDQIKDAKDRDQLVDWLQKAIHIDGQVHPKELELFLEISEHHQRTRTVAPYGESLIDRDIDRQFWNRLERIGAVLRKPVPWYRRMMFGFWWN